MNAKAGTALLFVILLMAAPLAMMPASALACGDGRQVTNEDTGASFCSLQAAIDAAGPGQTLLVSPGTYAEAVTIPSGKDGLTILATETREAILALPDAGSALKVRSADVSIHGLAIENPGGGTAVLVRGDGLVLRENRIDGRLNVPEGLGPLDVDARLNQWGSDAFDDVLRLVHAPGGVALVSPFLRLDGAQDPPAPTVTGATHCGGVGFAPRFIEEAIWCAHPSGTIVLHPSTSPGFPAPYQPTPDGFFGNPAGNLLFKNRGISGTLFGEPVWGSGYTPVGGHGGEPLTGLVVCSGATVTSGQDPPEPSSGGSCVDDPAGVVVDPLGNTDSALDVRADAITVSGLTLKNTGDVAGLHGLNVRAADALVTLNDVAGNFVPVEHNGGPTVNQIGINLLTGSDGSIVRGNDVHNWRNIGIYTTNGGGQDGTIVDNVVAQNRWTGILLEGPDGGAVDVRLNVIEESGDSAIRFGASDPSEWQVRQNLLDLTNLFGISIQSGVTGTVIDARLNHWGVDDHRVLGERVDDESATNTVLTVPYMRADGGAEPALPRGPVVPAADCEAHPDAEFVAGHCRFFTVQAAIDLATTGADIFLGRSDVAGGPTPHLETIDVDLGLGGSPLDGVTICGATGGLLCALDQVAGHYELRNLEWQAPPIAWQGQALLGESSGGTHFSHSFFPPDGFQIDDIDELRYDIFSELGACTLGNGRIALGIDIDGDGVRDGNVHVDAAKGCPNGEWTTIDMMALPATWTGFGASTTQAAAHAAAEAAANANGVSHQIAAVNVQVDSGVSGPAFRGYLDNIQLNGFLLGEQNDIECWFAQGANCRHDGAAAATVIQSDAGVRVADLNQDDQTLRGLTLRRTGDPGAHAYGARITGDGALLEGVQVLMQGGGCNTAGSCTDPAEVTALDVMGADAVIRNSTIAADLFSTETGVFGGVNGMTGDMAGALIEGNLFRAWRANHVFPFGDDVTVQSNVFESVGSSGVLVCTGNDNVQVLGNSFQGLAEAVAVCGATAPTNVQVHDNAMGLTNDRGLEIRAPLAGALIDAECNDWGVYQKSVIEETRIRDENSPSTNMVDVDPFTSPDTGGIQCLVGPAASFTMTPGSPTDRLTDVNFTDTSTAGSRPIVSWHWDLGDGTTSHLPLTNHTYLTTGTFTVRLTVTDAQGLTSTTTQTLVVENLDPVFDPIPDQTVAESGTLTLPLSATDPDGDDPVTFVVVSGPAGASVTNNGDGTGAFTWTAGASTVETVEIGARDSHAPTAGERTRSFDIVVGAGFDIAPVLDPIGDRLVQETANLNFGVTGSDADGDAMTLTFSPLPAGATLTQTGPGSWSFDWTPGLFQQGVHAITAELSDGQLADTEVFSITVDNLDQPPIIRSFPGDQFVSNGAPQSWYIDIHDPDGDPIDFTATGIPGGGSLSDNNAGRARVDWPARPTGTTSDICVAATAGGVSLSDCFAVTVTGWVDLDLTQQDGAFVDGAPGSPVSLSVGVRNLGTSPAVVDFASESDRGWATTAPASIVLAGGEYQEVAFEVTAGAAGSQSRIKFVASTSDNEGERENLYWRVRVPVLMEVDILQRDGVNAVSGEVRAFFVDGSPAAGVGLRLTDVPEHDVREALTSELSGVTGADGTFAFSFGAADLHPGAHVVGMHELTVVAQGDGRSDRLVTEYVVGML